VQIVARPLGIAHNEVGHVLILVAGAVKLFFFLMGAAERAPQTAAIGPQI